VTDNSARRATSRATRKGPGPGDFPVGSPESRAAARLLLSDRESARDRLEIISSIPRPERNGHRNDKPRATPWTETPDGRLVRFLYVPQGMTEESARKAVDSRGEMKIKAENYGTMFGRAF